MGWAMTLGDLKKHHDGSGIIEGNGTVNMMRVIDAGAELGACGVEADEKEPSRSWYAWDLRRVER